MTHNIRAPHMPWISPYLAVSNPEESIAFYEKAFGFKVKDKVEDNGKIMHVEMTHYDEVVVMFADAAVFTDGARKTPKQLGLDSPVNFYVYFKDVDSTFKQAVAAGATVRSEPADQFWGDRYGQVMDIDGYLWAIATHKGT